MKKGSVVTVCPSCRKVFNFRKLGFTEKPLDYPADIKDVGIECPNCNYFQHSFYLSKELEAMQNPDATRKERREYKRKYLKLQNWVKKKIRTRDGIST